jgi:two-component system, OmpR family, sensor kinase
VSEDEVRRWVRDDGTGIEAADQSTIFERFARGREGASADRDDSGSGLGLSIVSAIAEAHHGTVLLESAPGSGSTFTLVMPQQPGEVSDPRMTQQEDSWQPS